MSEAVLLTYSRSGPGSGRIRVTGPAGSYSFDKKDVLPPGFILSPALNKPEAEVLKKIYSAAPATLGANAVFALGIVTGNNKKFLLNRRLEGSEAVYRGRDIEPYKLKPPECFIRFAPAHFQQTAREELYRRPKIVYRFIGERLTCAYDEEGVLLLNSANLLVSPDYPMTTIAGLLNSPIYSFILQKKFHSQKVLKSHLKSLPLPLLSKKQHEYFFNTHSRMVQGKISVEDGQAGIDALLVRVFGLSEGDVDLIFKKSFDKSKAD
jgi:hypothetical protein